jgi:hypothetical protein
MPTAIVEHRLRQITASLIANEGQKGYDLAAIYDIKHRVLPVADL